MKTDLTIAGITAAPGTKATGWLQVAELYDGSPVNIPVVVLNGRGEGPCLWIQSAAHGDEYIGIGAIHRLLETADPASLNGAVVILPWVNPLALRAGTRGASQDGMDMNRVYPGKPMSEAMHLFAHTEMVVYRIFELAKANADVVVDLHDGGRMGIMSSYIQYYTMGTEVDAKARAIAYASGMDIVWESPPAFVSEKAPGSFGTAAMPLGIPTLTMEYGGEGRLPEHYVARTHDGLERILRHLGILGGTSPALTHEQLFVRKGNWLRPARGGIFTPIAEAGARIAKGSMMGVVRDAFGTVVEELKAPVDGVVIGMRTYGVIATGEYAGNVAAIVDR